MRILLKNFLKIEFDKHGDTYVIMTTAFQNHHEQFNKIFQTIQSVFNSVQSAKEYYAR